MATAEKTKSETKTRVRETWSSSEIDHVWAHQKAAYGRSTGKQVFFRGQTIYSYGDHFPMARLLLERGKPAAVLITTRSYSTTTAGHLSDVRSAVRHLPAFYVDDVRETDHRKNLKEFREGIARAASQVLRAKSRTLYCLADLDRRIADADKYAKYFGLATRFGYPKGFDAAAQRERGAVEAQLQRDRDEKKSERRRVADAERRRQAEAKLAEARLKYPALFAEYEAGVTAWLAWDRKSFPAEPTNPDQPYRSYQDRPFDRLRAKGSRIETSQAVVVELAAAKPLLALVRRKGEGYTYLPDLDVGGYRGGSIDYATRTLKVGCHTFAFDEVERIARELGL